MDIWIVNHYALTPDMWGGTRHYDIAKELVRRGHRVRVFASSFHYASLKEMKSYGESPYLEETIDGIDFVWVKTRPYRGNTFARIVNMLDFMRKAIRVHGLGLPRPDVIVGSSVHLFAVYAAYRLSKRYAVPFVMEVRDIWPQTLIDMGVSRYHPFVLLLGMMEKFLYKKAAKIITLLPKADAHIRKFGVKESDIVWISNGVDLARFKEGRDVQLLDTNRFNVLYAGTFGTANNLDILLAVARRLEAFGDIHFTLEGYGWEKAIDTNTTWRIGDGTVAFYNYVYYTVAGFTEHDTFRSNQIREGQITREEALVLIEDENRPRYQNIKWYLDALGMNFEEVIKVVNSIPKLYRG